MYFSQNKKSRKRFEKVVSNIQKNLSKIDVEPASEFIDWLERKTILFKKSCTRSGYGKQPDDLSRGDIVWVEFGINVGTELSDYATKGHYAIVWLVDLGNVVVLPLTSKPSTGSNLTYEIGVIPNLVQEKENSISYLKLDAIRSISKRRIGRMPGKDGGKIRLDKDKINLIKELFRIHFID